MPNEVKGDMNGHGLRIAIAVARFNEVVTQRLLDGALGALERHGVRDSDITVAWVPGSFEQNMDQALNRAGGKSGNMGASSAAAAIETARVIQAITTA